MSCIVHVIKSLLIIHIQTFSLKNELQLLYFADNHLPANFYKHVPFISLCIIISEMKREASSLLKYIWIFMKIS